jgi:hypothetical protein
LKDERHVEIQLCAAHYRVLEDILLEVEDFLFKYLGFKTHQIGLLRRHLLTVESVEGCKVLHFFLGILEGTQQLRRALAAEALGLRGGYI